MNNHIVYCHYNKINGKRYIGQTKNSLHKRSGSKGQNYIESPVFYNAIQKYGWDNFEHIVLKEKLTSEEANYWERYYIELYHTYIRDDQCQGYNMTLGGDVNPMYNVHRFGELNPMSGKKHTEDSIQKNRINQPNRKPIICTTTNEYFLSITEAAKIYHLDPSNLSKALKRQGTCGQLSTGERLKWEYLDNNSNAVFGQK